MELTEDERELRELYARWLDHATKVGFRRLARHLPPLREWPRASLHAAGRAAPLLDAAGGPLHRRDWVQLALAGAQVIVLLLAASGLLAGGG